MQAQHKATAFVGKCHVQLYTISSGLRWTINGSNDFQLLSLSKIPKFEIILGSFIFDNIKNSPKFDKHSIKAIVAQVKKQTVSTDLSELMIDSEIKIIYSSNESKQIDDISSRLSQIFSTVESLKPLLDLLQKENILKADIFSRDVTFPPVAVAPTKGDELSTQNNSNLITTLTVSVIILIGLLLTVSIALIFFAKGKDRKSGNNPLVGENSKYGIQQTNTQDTMNSSDSPTGILGAKYTYGQQHIQNGRNDGVLISMTPTRGVYDSDYDCNTPGSLTSEVTNVTQFSDTSKRPLGIVSMGKLDNLLVNPRKPPTVQQGLYQMNTP